MTNRLKEFLNNTKEEAKTPVKEPVVLSEELKSEIERVARHIVEGLFKEKEEGFDVLEEKGKEE